VVIDLPAEAPPPDPAAAPPVPEADPAPPVVRVVPPGGAAWGAWAFGAALGLCGLWLGLAAWDWALALAGRVPLLAAVAWALLAVLALALLAWAWGEVRGWRRLRRLDGLRAGAEAALAAGDLAAARRVAAGVARLYGGPAWGADLLDPDAVLAAAERALLAGPDAAARAEVEAAARQVALLTAMVPLALADVAAALVINLRMVRRVAAAYGGRPGALGSWRLIRAVAAHLAATGAVAVGDDLLGHALGGGLLAKLSRRFGEGAINGALTARVGLSAMAVCRPLPFAALPRPGLAAVTGRALAGLFGRA
jgi:putative membrane protein